MVKKQKGQKLSLQSFLTDETFGGQNWADEEIDYSSISVPVQTSKPAFDATGSGFSSRPEESDRFQRREYPVPDAPPFKARINNLPWDVTEEDIAAWISDNLGYADAFTKLVAPKDEGRLKGFAFVNFNTRDDLIKALDFSGEDLNGRRVYIAVAAPEREGFGRSYEDQDFDWGARRGPLPPREFGNDPAEGGRRERRPPRNADEEQDFDWGSRRGPLPANDRFGNREFNGERRERREREEEPEFDWGSRRGPLPPRELTEEQKAERRERFERKPRQEEPEFDWGSRRGPLPPKELTEEQKAERRERFERKPRQEEPEFDWSARRGPLPPKELTEEQKAERKERAERRAKREEPDFDWSARKGPLATSDKSSRSNSNRSHENKRSNSNRKNSKQEDSLDWSHARGSGKVISTKKNGNNRNNKETETKTQEAPSKPTNSIYHVLATEGDEAEDDEDAKVEQVTEKTKQLIV